MIIDLLLKSLVSIAVAGAIRLGFMVYTFLTNHAPHIQAAAEEARDAAIRASDEIKTIPAAIEKQTTTIVNELREQRSDIRNLTAKL